MHQENNTFYDETPFQYGFSSTEEIIQNMNPTLKDIIKKNKDKIICDIGCGCGRNLIYSTKYGSRVVGVDISKKSLDFARSLISSNCLDLIEGDNLAIPLKDNYSDLVISDGVIHHTGDASAAFSECVRIMKYSSYLYLAVYKKWRYYSFLYTIIGGFFRYINNFKIGNFIIEKLFVRTHFILYKIFKNQKLDVFETRNIFFDYFITPVATFHSKKEVVSWIRKSNCTLVKYNKTKGNCHVFIIRKEMYE